RGESGSRMGETRIAQPCIFALQVGLTWMLRDRGILPAAVVGHSIGELAAAVAADVLSLEEATRIVFWRSRCQAQAEGRGAMASLGLSERDARKLLERYEGKVETAATNGPTSITTAGDPAPVDAILRELEERQIFCRRLDVSVPFHCRLMDPIEADFRR